MCAAAAAAAGGREVGCGFLCTWRRWRGCSREEGGIYVVGVQEGDGKWNGIYYSIQHRESPNVESVSKIFHSVLFCSVPCRAVPFLCHSIPRYLSYPLI
jgi:hypothetical protein